MKKELKTRLLTAGVLAGAILLCGVIGAWTPRGRFLLLALAFLACSLAAFEFARVCAGSPAKRVKGAFYFGAAFLPVFGELWFFSFADPSLPLRVQLGALVTAFALLFVSFTLALVFSMLSAKANLAGAENIARDLFIGIFLVGYCGAVLMALTMNEGSHKLLLWLLLVVCLNDTAAYFVGKNLGGPKLSPVISPAKTVSGSLGGLLMGLLVGSLCYRLLGFDAPLWMAAVLSVLTVAAAQTGDLAKSYLKRLHSVKDSGSLLPGHGGVLDRIDGILMASPVLYIWLVLRLF